MRKISERMIGIFDSGVGGLSVFREIRRLLPREDYIYYADNANCPYGDRPVEFVIGRAREITELLIREGIQTRDQPMSGKGCSGSREAGRTI